MIKTLIVLAHPDLTRSRMNKALIEVLRDQPGVTIHDLYTVYKIPEAIDVAKEQALLLEHDRIVFQFPLYWYSTPGLLKEWQDRVLEYGFAYGSRGDKLAGKHFMIATTTGAPAAAYASSGMTMAEVLKPLHMTARKVQMQCVSPFVLHGALEIDDQTLAQQAERYRSVLLDDLKPD